MSVLKWVLMPLWLPVRVLFGAVQPARPDEATPRRGQRVVGYMSHEQPMSERELPDAAVRWFGELGQTLNGEPAAGAGGVLMSFGRFVIEGGGHGVGADQEDDTNQLEANYGAGYVSLGMVLLQNRFVRIYPLVGAGGAGGSLEARLGTEEHGASWGSVILNMGIGVDFTLRLWRFNFVIGARIGSYSSMVGLSRNLDEDVEMPRGPFVRFIAGPGLEL